MKTFFPVGYEDFHSDKGFNYSLNRWYSLGFTDADEIQRSCRDIKTFDDWEKTMIHLARKAEDEQRTMAAATYWRAAEFYVKLDRITLKKKYYQKYLELFEAATDSVKFERYSIPYQDKHLRALRFPSNGSTKPPIVIHGGFDSFLEEWFFIMKFFNDNGYEVIGFEGPGQGGTLLETELALDYRWERPVEVVLDYFHLEDVVLFGLSMGGWFATRAAAYEKRIRALIVSGHAVDYSRIPPAFARALMMFFVNHFRKMTTNSFEKVAAKDDINAWKTSNLAHITQLDPIEAFEYSLNLNEQNLCSHMVNQDVLYLTGADDHLVPMKMHHWQVKLFTNTRSLKDVIFTESENAQNHCQIGNIGLMLNICKEWLDSIE